MANHKSSKARIRRNENRAVINGTRRNRIRSFIKNVELAIAAGNHKDAEEAFKVAQPEIQRGVAKGIIRKTTASRKISRLSSRIKGVKKAA